MFASACINSHKALGSVGVERNVSPPDVVRIIKIGTTR